MTRRRYPIGIQTFSKIRENDMLYIDKTEYIYNMAHAAGTYYFLSRPRRFGKSLLVSTMQSYFEGRRDLFRGLAIEKLEKEWTEYPVILLSMAGAKHMDVEGLQEYLLYILKVNEERFGVEFHSAAPNLRLTNLIMAVYEKTGRQVVVLIDEYDAPLLDVAHEESQLVAMRDIMRNFYSPLKDCDPYLRFVFLTGITKFSQLSIFSELNNISNISMKDDYAGICGITETELLDDMQDGIAGLAQANELTPQQVVAKLKENYDGYHFSAHSPGVFNPFSLLSSLANKDFDSYWFASGTPTYLVNMLQRFNVQPASLQRMCDQQMLFIIFTLLTHYVVDVEVHTPKGRVDIVMLTADRLYLIELKLNKDADAAMKQIDLKNYAERFALSGKLITKVGINFDSSVGNITDWRIA